MPFGPGILLWFSGCKYATPPPPLYPSLTIPPISLPLCVCVCVCERQTSRVQSSELIKGFIPLPGSCRIAIWTLFIHKCCPGNNVYFYYHLGGEGWKGGGGGLRRACRACLHTLLFMKYCLSRSALKKRPFFKPLSFSAQSHTSALSPCVLLRESDQGPQRASSWLGKKYINILIYIPVSLAYQTQLSVSAGAQAGECWEFYLGRALHISVILSGRARRHIWEAADDAA